MGYIKLFTTICTYLIVPIVVENQLCKTSKYYDRHPGLQLKDHLIKNITTSDIWFCVTECSQTPGCLSINTHNAGGVIHCDLNKSNRYGSQVDLIQTGRDREYLEIVSSNWPNACFQKGGWYRIKSSAYKFINETVTARVARQRCAAMSAGADLASFANKEEEKMFEEYLKGFGEYHLWIGLSDFDQEGTFVWADGTKLSYSNWQQDEPNNSGGDEDCVAKLNIQSWSGKWNDDNCLKNKTFACGVSCI